MAKRLTPSEEELQTLKEPRFWSDEERPWREQQTAKIHKRMADFAKAWSYRTPNCYSESCRDQLTEKKEGLVVPQGDGSTRFYCPTCRTKVWDAFGKRVGLYP